MNVFDLKTGKQVEGLVQSETRVSQAERVKTEVEQLEKYTVVPYIDYFCGVTAYRYKLYAGDDYIGDYWYDVTGFYEIDLYSAIANRMSRTVFHNEMELQDDMLSCWKFVNECPELES